MDEKILNGTLTLLAFLGTSVILGDLASVCGELLDSEVFKFVVLFAVIYGRSQNDMVVTAILLAGYAIVRWLLIWSRCQPSKTSLILGPVAASPAVFR